MAITLKQQICKSHTIFSPALGNPSCLQTTRAPMLSQKSSHTVPQALLKHTSTRPSSSVSPPTSLTVPLVQEVWGGSEGRVRNCGQLDSEGLALNPGFSNSRLSFWKKIFIQSCKTKSRMELRPWRPSYTFKGWTRLWNIYICLQCSAWSQKSAVRSYTRMHTELFCCVILIILLSFIPRPPPGSYLPFRFTMQECSCTVYYRECKQKVKMGEAWEQG